MTIHQTAARQLGSLATSFEFIYARAGANSARSESQSGAFRAEEQSQRELRIARLYCGLHKSACSDTLLTDTYKALSISIAFSFT